MTSMKKGAVIGEGAWGTAIAIHLAAQGYSVYLWCQDPEVAHSISTTRINTRYLPTITLDTAITPTTDLAQAVAGVTYIFQATPVMYLRSVLEQLKPHIRNDQGVVLLSKGIENDTLLFPLQLADEVLGRDIVKAIIAGPSFAQEVARRCMTAVVIASEDATCARHVQTMFESECLIPFTSSDVMGVQVAAALKNVIALGVGLVEGAGLAENTKALLITQGLAEMATLAQHLGGTRDTMYGLAGVGDVVLSALGTLGRNVAVGRQLGQGKTLVQIQQDMSVLPESINTTRSMHQLMMRHKISLPLCQAIYRMVHESAPVEKEIGAVLAQLRASLHKRA